LQDAWESFEPGYRISTREALVAQAKPLSMSLSIETDKVKYYGHDQIRGTVTLSSETVEYINSAVLTFRGFSKVKLTKDSGTGPRPHYSNQILFSHSKILHSGDLTLPPGSHKFAFEIPIPSQSDRNQGEDVLISARPFHGSKDRHPLPPSFTHSISDFEAEFICVTEYTLEANVSRPSIMDKNTQRALQIETDIIYIPARPLVLEPEWKMLRDMFVARTLRLLPDKANKRLSVRERVRSTFKTSELPSATFHTVLWVPTRLTQGESCPVRISIRYGDTTAPANPTIILKAIRIDAIADVAVRTRSLVGDYRVGHLHSQTILDRKDLDIEIPGGMSDTMDTEHLYIDFASCNISVASKLDLELQIICADKKFSVYGRTPLTVLPPITDV